MDQLADQPASLLPAVLRTPVKGKRRRAHAVEVVSAASACEPSSHARQAGPPPPDVGKPWRFETQIKAEPAM
jgi:hypothetical protein